jgi:hypothetical protein
LFDQGKRPLAVAFLMHISKKAINGHHKAWLELGGRDRPPVELPGLYDEGRKRKRRR